MTIIVVNTLKGLCYRKSDCQNDNYEIAYIIIGKGSSLSGIVFEPGILGTPRLPCPIRGCNGGTHCHCSSWIMVRFGFSTGTH